MFGKCFSAIRSLVLKDKVERELDAELRFHLEMEIELNIKKGMSPKQARYVALRNFGGVEKFKEECRDLRGSAVFETLFEDIRFGFRMLAKQPGFTVMALAVLAL